MTPSAPSSPGDRLMIWVVTLIVLTCIIVSALLAWHGKDGAIAAFIGIAGTALGILSPSPLKQHGQSGGGSSSQVDAPNATTVNVSQPAAPNVPIPVPVVVEEGEAKP